MAKANARPIAAKKGTKAPRTRPATSPLVTPDGHVITGETGDKGFWIAVDKDTGATIHVPKQ